MARDPYAVRAGIYAAVVDRMNSKLHAVAFRSQEVSPGMKVLDVGCGTGAQLARYVEAGCVASGVDLSPSMLAKAQERFGDSADIRLADATELPYDDASFDVVLASLFLHELAPDFRRGVVAEIARVLRADGTAVIVDFGVGDLDPRGRATRMISRLFEIGAGRAHYAEYRRFLATGGVPASIEGSGMRILSSRPLAGGDLTLVRVGR